MINRISGIRAASIANNPYNKNQNIKPIYNQTPSFGSIRRMPKHDRVFFGMSFGDKPGINEDGNYKNLEYLHVNSITTGRSAELGNAIVEETLKTGWALESEGTVNAKNMDIGTFACLNNATVTETLKTTKGSLESEGTVNAKNMEIGTDAYLKNATVEETLKTGRMLDTRGIVNAKNIDVGTDADLNNAIVTVTETLQTGRNLTSENGTVNAKVIIAGGDIYLNNVNAEHITSAGKSISLGEIGERIQDIAFVSDTDRAVPRTLEIKTKLKEGQKIKVILANIRKLVIKTPEEVEEALKHFDFAEITERTADGLVQKVRDFSGEDVANLIKQGAIEFRKLK